MKGKPKTEPVAYPLVQIGWRDAWGSAEWIDIEEARTGAKGEVCNSVGFLLEENEEGYLLASTLSGKQANGRFFVPKGMAKRG